MRQLILDINARKTLEERPTPNKIDKALRRLWGWLYDRRTAVDFLGFALLFDMMPHGKRLLENTAYALGIPIWGQLLLELVLFALSTNFGQRIIQETGYAYLDIFPNGSSFHTPCRMFVLPFGGLSIASG